MLCLALKNSIRSLEKGTSVNLMTADRVSPLHEACLGGHSACASVLLKHGAHKENMEACHVNLHQNKTQEQRRGAASLNAVNGATIDWNTPLFNACINGSVDCLNLLLQHGASPHAVCDLASPIHEAAKRGHIECVESLVSHGVSIDHNIKHLGTPLSVACENQQVDCTKKLLESGASANSGKGLDSPLHIAAQKSNADLVHLLIDFGADTRSLNAEGKKPAEMVPSNSTLAQIFLQREGPLSLMQLCRLYIRRYLGSHQQRRISELLLPDELKRFLLYL
ncbi:ankyrin repeat and SOCS box protein 9 isoform X3 [Hemicordylus capensis]|uniref:ankyrin repeat and SOCS box protein 9 isoform X3 n=1 Tax=Hemicordylus capensis TaxID=884348 RepID=UPI0023034FDA|nr:ankyrin repeat and SOCS box protein 9 isoform X3 [Hemicordylus capensis]